MYPERAYFHPIAALSFLISHVLWVPHSILTLLSGVISSRFFPRRNSLFLSHNEHLCMGLPGYLSQGADTISPIFGNIVRERERPRSGFRNAFASLIDSSRFPFRPAFVPSYQRPRWRGEIEGGNVYICTVGLRLRSFGSRRARDNCGRMGKTLPLSGPSEVLR